MFWDESSGNEDFKVFISSTDTCSTTVSVRRDSGWDREEELRAALLSDEEEEEEEEE